MIPTIDEVKKYFKNAETGENAFGVNIVFGEIKKGHVPETYMSLNLNHLQSDGATVWDKRNGYAKILTEKKIMQ